MQDVIRQMIRIPWRYLLTMITVLIVIFLVLVMGGLFYSEVSTLYVLMGAAIYLFLIIAWALSRTIPRTRRYKKHLLQFGSPCEASDIDFEKTVLAAIPFESSRVIVLVFWNEEGIVFGRRDVYRKILFADIDDVNEMDFMGYPIIQAKLKNGKWDDQLFIPLDTKYKIA